MYEGLCRGGPLNGQPLASRYPKGVLLVDKPAGRCWVYEWRADEQAFEARDPAGAAVLTEGPINRYRAAAEPNYDVVAAPWVGADTTTPGEVTADGNAGQ